MRLWVWMLLAAWPAQAQDDAPAVNAMVLDQCSASDLAEGCIGMGARLCVSEYGAMAQGLCAGAETAYWRARAEAALATLRPRAPEIMARAARLGWPEPQPSLEAVEAGFAAYRDAACGWRMAQWDGVHAGFEGADCDLQLTARHALWLERQARVE